MRKHLESNLQKACVRWAKFAHPNIVLFAVPNGGYRSATEAAVMKGEGVISGVSDLILLKSNQDYHGLMIELKSPKGKQTDAQRLFEKNVTANGYKYVVCRDLQSFIKIINEYLKN